MSRKFIHGEKYINIENLYKDDSYKEPLYFCFSEPLVNNYTHCLFAKESNLCDYYKNFEDYLTPVKNKSVNEILNFFEAYEPKYFIPYSKKVFTLLSEMKSFIGPKITKYSKVILFSKLYTTSNPQDDLYSITDKYLNKPINHYKTYFYFFLINCVLLGFFKKLLFYIPIFLIDIFIATISNYKNYKSIQSDLKKAKAEHIFQEFILNHGLSFNGNNDLEKAKNNEEEIQQELTECKKNYINHNIAFFSLIFTLLTLLFSTIYTSISSSKQHQSELENLNKYFEIQLEIESLKNQNNELEIELKNEKNNNAILSETIKKQASMTAEIQNEMKMIREGIDKIDKTINSLKK